jgi:class 3 adenylate cyclase
VRSGKRLASVANPLASIGDPTRTWVIAVHPGEPAPADGLCAGVDVQRATRAMSAAHGGKIPLPRWTADLAGGEVGAGLCLIDLGVHRLEDLSEPRRLFQGRRGSAVAVLSAAAAPVRMLPRPLTRFLGREQELQQPRHLLHDA